MWWPLPPPRCKPRQRLLAPTSAQLFYLVTGQCTAARLLFAYRIDIARSLLGRHGLRMHPETLVPSRQPAVWQLKTKQVLAAELSGRLLERQTLLRAYIVELRCQAVYRSE